MFFSMISGNDQRTCNDQQQTGKVWMKREILIVWFSFRLFVDCVNIIPSCSENNNFSNVTYAILHWLLGFFFFSHLLSLVSFFFCFFFVLFVLSLSFYFAPKSFAAILLVPFCAKTELVGSCLLSKIHWLFLQRICVEFELIWLRAETSLLFMSWFCDGRKLYMTCFRLKISNLYLSIPFILLVSNIFWSPYANSVSFLHARIIGRIASALLTSRAYSNFSCIISCKSLGFCHICNHYIFSFAFDINRQRSCFLLYIYKNHLSIQLRPSVK